MRRALVATALIGAACAGVGASSAWAQDASILGQGQWYVSPMVSYLIDDEDRFIRAGSRGIVSRKNELGSVR